MEGGEGGLDLLHFILLHPRLVVEALTERGEGPAGEENDPLQLLVEEEVVEAPERAVLSEGVRGQVRVVAVDVAVEQVDLVVEGDPELVVDLGVLGAGGHREQVVNILTNKLQARLLCELLRLGVGEAVVGEGGVESGDEVEEGLPGDRVAEDALVFAS